MTERRSFIEEGEVEAFGFDWSMVRESRSRFHATLNIGDAPLRIFVAFTPSGSEHEWRELPDFRLIPPGGSASSGTPALAPARGPFSRSASMP